MRLEATWHSGESGTTRAGCGFPPRPMSLPARSAKISDPRMLWRQQTRNSRLCWLWHSMRRIRSTLLLLGLAGGAVGALAQQTPANNPTSGETDPIPQDRASEPAGALQSARSFDGTIVKLRSQFVLRNATAHTSYRLDDQKKAMHYAGRRVKVTATMDSVSNTLHVIDISDSSKSH